MSATHRRDYLPFAMGTMDGLDLLDGYRHHTTARSTGTTIVLVDSEEDPHLDPDEARWALICVDHEFIWLDDDQVALRAAMARPETWCRGCKRKRSKRSG